MTELVECTRCRKVMIDEEYQDHLCEPVMQGCKIIKFTSYYTAKTSDGRTILDITALDGESYMFEHVPEDKEHTKIPFEPTNRHLTRRKPTDDLPEPEKLSFIRYPYRTHTKNVICSSFSMEA